MEKNEEWNNFMHKVSEISNIIQGLTSEDAEISKRAITLADKYVNEKTNIEVDENIEIKLKSNRTIINKCTKSETPTNPDEMNPETFMKVVGQDAEQRAADRKVRLERAETLKTRASKAFKRGDYELALSCYNKAIEQIKDSCLLYTNRALTNIKLLKYDKVIHDCEWALRINQNSLKAQLYRTKAYQGIKNKKEFEKCYNELIEKFPQYKEIINDFLKQENNEDNSEDSE